MLALTGLMIIMISTLLMTQQKYLKNSGSTTPVTGLPCFIQTLQTTRRHPTSFWSLSKPAADFWYTNSCKRLYRLCHQSKGVNRYKDRHVLSKAKSDTLDALSLGNILRTDRHLFRPLNPLPEDYRLLDRLCTDLRKVVDEKSRVANQVTSCLKEFYPKALDIFSLNSQIFIDFLKAFPDHQTLNACKKRHSSRFSRNIATRVPQKPMNSGKPFNLQPFNPIR